ncbi:hypothetical protein [Azospirillum argentinense]|uniref:hypothetical protein n=1 Tax=Azospirillum argentinense TaxID=2970906 RepID=UPI0015862B5B|nr:hypothetical protein [Azospirillum argentinense]
MDRKVERVIRRRAEEPLDWATGEALAFATLLAEGTPVRLTGQDVVRGAFSHRHFALTDTVTGRRHVSLNHLGVEQARFDVVNSPLSEYAVLGFEYGYSLERPDALVIWEAQFGDFANGAQIMIDQFIVSAEDKWRQPSGLVILLRTGWRGRGRSIPPPGRSASSRWRRATTSASPIPRPGQLLPPAAPADAAPRPQAAGGAESEDAAAPARRRVDAGRLRAGHRLPAGDRHRRRGRAHPAVQRQAGL